MSPGMIDVTIGVLLMCAGAFCVKHWIWGRGPIVRRRELPGADQFEHRLAELEERLEYSTELGRQQQDQITDLEERLDFAERLLTRGDRREAEQPRIATPA